MFLLLGSIEDPGNWLSGAAVTLVVVTLCIGQSCQVETIGAFPVFP